MKLIVAIAVGLRPKDLAHAPVLRGLGEHGFAAPLDTIFPAAALQRGVERLESRKVFGKLLVAF